MAATIGMNRRHAPEALNGASPPAASAQPVEGRRFSNFMQCVKDARTQESPGDRSRLYSNGAAHKRIESVYDSGFTEVQKSALSEAQGLTGGYLVPRDYSTELMGTIEEESVILPRARVEPMLSQHKDCPVVQVEVASGVAGVPSFFGNMSFTWGFQQTPVTTAPQFRQLGLDAWDLLGLCTVSNQYFQDTGPEGEKWLMRLFARAAAWFMEYAFFQGIGAATSMPLGILNCPAAKLVARQTSAVIKQADIANMAAALLPFSRKHAIWACSSTALAQVIQITEFVLNRPVSDDWQGSTGALIGRPLFDTDKLPAPGSNVNGDIVLFDPSLYVVGLRQDVLVDASSLGPAYPTYQTDFRVWLRCDGKCQVSAPILLQDQVTTVSPIVILQGK